MNNFYIYSLSTLEISYQSEELLKQFKELEDSVRAKINELF